MQIKVHYDSKADRYTVNLVDPARLWLVVDHWWYNSPLNVGQKVLDLQAEGHTLDRASYDRAMGAPPAW